MKELLDDEEEDMLLMEIWRKDERKPFVLLKLFCLLLMKIVVASLLS